MKLPKSVLRLIESFERLPGIGPKSAQRLTFYLLNFPQEEILRFSGALAELKAGTKMCSICRNVGEDEVCGICSDSMRNKNQIMVVSNFLDTYAMEKTGYKGHYHVLGGVIDPLNNIGPDELYISDLLKRISDYTEPFEIILATSTSMEGESTSLYLTKLIKEHLSNPDLVKITRIARGLPVGSDIEYADDTTLSRALEGRSIY